MRLPLTIFTVLRCHFKNKSALVAENLALRQQLAMYKRTMKKPRPKQRDRLFWVILYRFWPGWRNALAVFTPDTVVMWHRAGFRLFWKWKSRPTRPGRPQISPEIRAVIKAMTDANPLWGAPRIHGELLRGRLEV